MMRTAYFTRSQWGARTELPRRGAMVDSSERKGIVIHHTVTSSPVKGNVWSQVEKICHHMRQLQIIRPDLGSDVPYSFVAFLSGAIDPESLVICEGRGFERSAAHSTGLNRSHFGVAFAGNFEAEPSGALPDALQAVAAFLLPYIGRPVPITGHRDYKQTACPGKHLYEALNRPWMPVTVGNVHGMLDRELWT